MPKTMPVIALAPSAATTAIGGTDAATGVKTRTSDDAAHPRKSPIDAPDAVSVIASTRNCQRMITRANSPRRGAR